MKRVIIVCCCVLAVCSCVYGQIQLERQALTIAGGHYTDGSLELTQSLGQVATATVQSDELILTQGFQQPSDNITSTYTAISFNKLRFYPNPVQDYGNLQLDIEESFQLQIELFNIAGQLIRHRTESLNKGTNSLSFDYRDLSAGIYLMKLTDEDQALLKTVRIVIQ
ncbi:MAG: T9SS type A sorting domain-containing protein [Bacteroidota bacterium]